MAGIVNTLFGGGTSPNIDTSMTNPIYLGGIENTLGTPPPAPAFVPGSQGYAPPPPPTSPVVPANTNTPGTTTTTTPALTPAQLAMQQNVAQQLGVIHSNEADAASTAAGNLYGGPNGVVATINSLRAGQTGIDQGRIQDNLAKIQGLQGVLQMVNHGIQSGGITLANANASNSSAGDALARAYGIQGRESASQVGNQFALNENKQDVAQTNQDMAANQGILGLKASKASAISSIVQDAASKLAYLSSIASSMGLTGSVDLANEQQAIKNDALAKLSAYDDQIAGATPGVMAPGDIAAKAQSLATAGTASAEPFNFTTAGPAQLQGTGPVPSDLPIFVAPRKTT